MGQLLEANLDAHDHWISDCGLSEGCHLCGELGHWRVNVLTRVVKAHVRTKDRAAVKEVVRAVP